jgi:hypothetical protein
MFASNFLVALDDVDQRLADDERPHVDSLSSVSSVARAPSRCNDSSAHR